MLLKSIFVCGVKLERSIIVKILKQQALESKVTNCLPPFWTRMPRSICAAPNSPQFISQTEMIKRALSFLIKGLPVMWGTHVECLSPGRAKMSSASKGSSTPLRLSVTFPLGPVVG